MNYPVADNPASACETGNMHLPRPRYCATHDQKVLLSQDARKGKKALGSVPKHNQGTRT